MHASLPIAADRLGARTGLASLALAEGATVAAEATATAPLGGGAAIEAITVGAAEASVGRAGSLGLPWHAALTASAATPIPLLRILLLAVSIRRIYRHAMRWLPSRAAGLALLTGALAACSAAPPPPAERPAKVEVPKPPRRRCP